MTSALQEAFPNPERHSVNVLVGLLLKEWMPTQTSMPMQELMLAQSPMKKLILFAPLPTMEMEKLVLSQMCFLSDNLNLPGLILLPMQSQACRVDL